MPIVPNFLERLFFLHLNRGPGLLLEVFQAVGFRTVVAAIRLGMMDALDGSPMTPSEAARQIGADERGTAILLDTLEALGYVRKKRDRYANTKMTSRWLVRSSPTNFSDGFLFWAMTLPALWPDLEASVRTGRPSVDFHHWMEHHGEESQAFQSWMIAIARFTAGEIVAKLKLPPLARRLLDVGGGHGTYSIALCRHHPDLSATIFDSPRALEAARANIVATEMSGRVAVQEGDFWKDTLGSGYDVALLFNIVHSYDLDKNIELFRRVGNALRPGGLLVILDQVADRIPGSALKAVSRILELNYFHLLGGRIYSRQEILRGLAAAGFTNFGWRSLRMAPANSLVFGTKAG